MSTDQQRKAGCKGGQLFCILDNPNEIFIFFTWDTKENATRFLESEDQQKNSARRRVVGKPEVHFFEKIEDFSV
jgi:heme-degrading monooxygenase HmoA